MRVRVKLACALIPLVLFAAAPRSATQQVRDAVLISNNLTSGEVQNCGVDTDGDLTAAVFINDLGDEGVYVSLSDGRGLTWSSPRRIDAAPLVANKWSRENSGFVEVAGDGIYVCWADDRHGPLVSTEVYFAYSHDRGLTWAPEQLIADPYAVGAEDNSRHRFMVDDNGTSTPSDDHVYFLNRVSGSAPMDEDELYLIASHDGGQSFSAPVHVAQSINPGAADIDAYSMFVAGNTVHVLFSYSQVLGNPLLDDTYYQKSTDGGLTWLPADVQLNSGFGSDAGGESMIVAQGDLVFACWDEDRSVPLFDEIRAQVSNDGGATWLAQDIRVGDYLPGLADVDSIAAAIVDGAIFVTWDDNRSGSDAQFVAVSRDQGNSFQETRLSNLPTPTSEGYLYPGMALSSRAAIGADFTCVSWRQDLGGPDVLQMSVTRDAGLTWSEPMVYSPTSGDIDGPEEPLAYNRLYNNFIGAWEANDVGVDLAYVGGLRPSALQLIGDFAAGQAIHFEGRSFAAAESGNLFRVVGSDSLGSFLFDGVRDVGISTVSTVYAQVFALNISGIIQADGVATTASVSVPVVVPAGFVMYFVAGSVSAAGGFGSVTDILTAVAS